MQMREGLEGLKSYSVPEESWAIKLDANEQAFNLPPVVGQRLADQLTAMAFNRYPEISQHSLRTTIAAGLGLKPENVAIGNGSSELLATLCFVFGGPGRKIVVPQPSFSMYPVYCQLADSLPVPVALETDFRLSPQKVIEAARREAASLILLSNPNNPTGRAMSVDDVAYIVREADCPVIIDEAYGEFSGQSALDLLSTQANLVIVRTFSKFYGLAAARVGYALAAPAIIAALHKALLPYRVSALALAAAQIAFEMRSEFADRIATMATLRDELSVALTGLADISVFPSVTNFVLFKTARAGELAGCLAEENIGVRDFSAQPGLKDCLRVTVGLPAENAAFLAVVRQFFAAEVK